MAHNVTIPTFSEGSSWIKTQVLDLSETQISQKMYGVASRWPGLVANGVDKGVSLLAWSVKALNGFVVGSVRKADDAASEHLFGEESALSLREMVAAAAVIGVGADLGLRFMEKIPKTLFGGVTSKETFTEGEWYLEKHIQEKRELKSRIPYALFDAAIGALFLTISSLTYKGWHDKVVSEGFEKTEMIGDVAVALAVLARLGWTAKKMADFWYNRDKSTGPIYHDEEMAAYCQPSMR